MTFFEFSLLAGKIIMVLALFIGGWRVFWGPTLPDRVVALDLVAGIVFGFAILIAIESERKLFLNVAMAIAVVSFIGTVAIARYVEKEARKK